MPTTFHVTAPDGHVLEITGPEGSTQEQAIEQAKKQYQPKTIPPNPSNTIALVKPPIPIGLQGPAPSRLSQAVTNLPYSVVKSIGNLASGPQMGEPSRDSSGRLDLTAGLHPLINSVKQMSFDPLIDAAVGDPVGAAQTVGGLTVGGHKVGVPKAVSAVGQGLKVAAPDLISGGSQVVGGEVLAKVPGMEWPARFGMGYPGARQIAAGVRKGFQATKDAFNRPPENLAAPIEESDIPGGQNKKRNFFSGESGSANVEKMNQIYENMLKSSIGSVLSREGPPTSYSDFPSARKVAPLKVPAAGAETRPVAPLGKASTQVPETPLGQPSSLTISETKVDPTQPKVIPHYNKFSQSGGPYKVISKGGVELGSYDNLANAQKAMSDSNFANKQLSVKGPEEANVKSSIQPQIEGQSIGVKPENIQTEPDQWTWETLKEKHGQDAVDKVRAKYSDLADRVKASNMSLQDFLDLPQEAKDAIVKVPKHPTKANRSKYSSGFNPRYTDLFKEIHGGEAKSQ